MSDIQYFIFGALFVLIFKILAAATDILIKHIEKYK
jgi:hypothetical protein